MRKKRRTPYGRIPIVAMNTNVNLPKPTPEEVVKYFESTYGSGDLFFTITALGRQGVGYNGTFGSDNFKYLHPWLSTQVARMTGGKVEGIAMVVRVFDKSRRVEIEGSKGKISIPEKELYMFRFSPENSIGFDPDVT